jgi:hypothetical protein
LEGGLAGAIVALTSHIGSVIVATKLSARVLGASPNMGARRAYHMYVSATYTANLCPLCGRAESASLGEDFGEAIRKSIEAASRRVIW